MKLNRMTAIFTVLLWPCVVLAADEMKLTVNEAIDIALKNNLNLELVKQESEMAESAVTANEGIFDPLLEAEVGGEVKHTTAVAPFMADYEKAGKWQAKISKKFKTGTEIGLGWDNTRYWNDTDYNSINPAYTSGFFLEFSQPILRGFGSDSQAADMRAAEKEAEAASFMVESEAADLAADVKLSYWQLVSAWQDIEVLELSLSLAKKLEEETQEKISTGLLAEVEIYQPQSIVALREQQLINGERAVGLAEDRLKLILNSDNWDGSIFPQDRPAIKEVKINSDEILDNAMTNRPDLKAAESAIGASRIKAEKLKDNTRPWLSLNGSVGINGTDDNYGDAATMNDGVDNQWQVGLVFSTFLDNKSRKSEYRIAQIELARDKTNLNLLKQQIRSLTRAAVRDVRLSLKTVEAAGKTAIASKKHLEAEQANFDVGRSTTFDVLTAQEAYAQAMADEYHARIAFVQSLAEIDRIQGKISR